MPNTGGALSQKDISKQAVVWPGLLPGRQHFDKRELALLYYISPCLSVRPSYRLGYLTISAQYIGEEGKNCVFKAAVVCSNPFNLEVCSKVLQNSLIGKEIYLRVLASTYLHLSISAFSHLLLQCS